MNFIYNAETFHIHEGVDSKGVCRLTYGSSQSRNMCQKSKINKRNGESGGGTGTGNENENENGIT